jgi:hypothetical protein
MKIRLRLKLDLVKMRPGFDGEQPEEQLSKQTIKTDPKRITKATISKVIDELSENLAAKFDLIGDFARRQRMEDQTLHTVRCGYL